MSPHNREGPQKKLSVLRCAKICKNRKRGMQFDDCGMLDREKK